MRLRDLRPGFMLDHLWTRRHLAEYVDGELDALGRRRVEQHARRCPECHRLIATLLRTVEGLGALRAAPAAPAAPASPVADGVIARLPEKPG